MSVEPKSLLYICQSHRQQFRRIQLASTVLLDFGNSSHSFCSIRPSKWDFPRWRKSVHHRVRSCSGNFMCVESAVCSRNSSEILYVSKLSFSVDQFRPISTTNEIFDWKWQFLLFVVKIGRNWSLLVIIGRRWTKLVKIDRRWTKLVKIGRNWSKSSFVVKTGRNKSKMWFGSRRNYKNAMFPLTTFIFRLIQCIRHWYFSIDLLAGSTKYKNETKVKKKIEDPQCSSLL